MATLTLTKTKTRTKVIVASTAAFFALAAFGASRSPAINESVITSIPTFTSQDRILIIAPHTDDEVLSSGGTILSGLTQKAQVKVVLMTNGDGNLLSTELEFRKLYPKAKDFIAAGERRQIESTNALMMIGLKEQDIIFLGYPDKGIGPLFTTNWPDHNPFQSIATDTNRSPYGLAYEKNALYSGENVLKNLKQIISDFRPTVVICSSAKDTHPDHKYSYEFTRLALSELTSDGSLTQKPDFYAYLIHYKNFPRPKGYLPGKALLPPVRETFNKNWRKVELSTQEVDEKYDAVRAHQSQIKVPELGTLMKGLVRKNELFEKIEY